MTADIDRLRSLEREATPGPWEAKGQWFGQVGAVPWVGDMLGPRPGRFANAAFVAEARNALPALLDEAERGRRALEMVGRLADATQRLTYAISDIYWTHAQQDDGVRLVRLADHLGPLLAEARSLREDR